MFLLFLILEILEQKYYLGKNGKQWLSPNGAHMQGLTRAETAMGAILLAELCAAYLYSWRPTALAPLPIWAHNISRKSHL